MTIYQTTQVESVEVEVRLKDGQVQIWCPRMIQPIIIADENASLIIRAASHQPNIPVSVSVES